MSNARCAIVLLLLAAAGLHGQSRSTILGTVTDESGAPIPGAEVKILNTGTLQQRTASTSERGDYEVTSLDVGVYDVSAQAPGFSVFVLRGLQLQVDQRARVDAQLRIGDLTQEISVTASATAIQTDDATLSTVVDAAKIRELPLPGNRNLFRLALLAPGMSRGPASSVTTSGFGPGFGIAAMGQKVHNNAILLDGAPLKTAIHGSVRMRPSVEAIEEFRVEAGWYSAQYGTNSPAPRSSLLSVRAPMNFTARCFTSCATRSWTPRTSSNRQQKKSARCAATPSAAS